MTCKALVRFLLLMALGSLVMVSPSWAGAGTGYPHGIFISGGKYQSPKLLSYGFVDGALLRVTWRALEPAPGRYDWTCLDSEIRKVR